MSTLAGKTRKEGLTLFDIKRNQHDVKNYKEYSKGVYECVKVTFIDGSQRTFKYKMV